MAATKSKQRRRDKPHRPQAKAVKTAATASRSVLVSFQRCNAVPWRPSPVVAVAICADQTLVAVARDNGSIELWNSASWTCVLVLPGKGDAAFTSLCWSFDHVKKQWRLFSCGLDGYVVEWCLRRRQPLATSSSMGGAAWHMAAKPDPPQSTANDEPEDPLMALATDDGAVRILAAAPNMPGLQYRSTAGRADARALSVTWRQDGKVVYAGFSDGCIRALDVESGTETLRITAGANPGRGREPACIWALACLPDGCLASGCSRGMVQFWETQFGTLLSSVQQHQADVNALAAAPDGSAVFAAGVDPSLVLMKRETPAGATPGGPVRYAYSDRRRPHTHDVRAMAMLRPPPPRGGGGSGRRAGGGAAPAQHVCLLTGGNDAELLVHSVDRFTYHHPVRVTAAPCAPAISFSQTGRFAVADRASLGIWQAAHAVVHGEGQSVREEGEELQPAKPPQHVACIEFDDSEPLLCSTISACGGFVASSSPHRTDVFAIVPQAVSRGGGGLAAADAVAAGSEAAPEWSVVRLRVPGGLPPACAIVFAGPPPRGGAKAAGRPRSTTLLVAALDSRLLALRVNVNQPDTLARAVGVPLPAEAHAAEDAQLAAEHTAYSQALPPVSHLAASPCGTLVAVITPHAAYLLPHDLSTQPPRFHAAQPLSLPHPPATRPVVAAAFSPCSQLLALSTVDERLEVYSCSSRTRLDWLHRASGLPAKLNLLSGHVVSLAFRPGPKKPRGAAAAADPADGRLGSIILCSRTRMCHISLSALKAGAPVRGAGVGGKTPRRASKSSGFSGEAPGLAVRVIALRSVLLGAGWVSESSLLTVQADRQAAMKQLPPPLLLKLYRK
eukprot:jgi/Ulvmu1/10378/UM061_0061.1